jgi:hypothetical protein
LSFRRISDNLHERVFADPNNPIYKEITMAAQVSALKTELGERDGVMRAMQNYIDGLRLGSSEVMRSGFHEGATISGCVPGGAMANPIKALFDWGTKMDRHPICKPNS